MSIDGARVIVTGASSGIGQAIAKMFSDEGAFVTNIDIASGADTEALCESRVRTITADVGIPADVDRAFQEYDRLYDGLPPAILCNVAGVAPEVAFLRTSVEIFDRTVAINLRGPFLCSQHAARRMIAAKTRGAGVRAPKCLRSINDLALPVGGQGLNTGLQDAVSLGWKLAPRRLNA